MAYEKPKVESHASDRPIVPQGTLAPAQPAPVVKCPHCGFQFNAPIVKK